jgi:hypothetical protein
VVFDEPVVVHCYTTPKDAHLRDPQLQGAEVMKDKPKLDAKKIAKALGAEPGGKVSAKGGYFGAMQLVAEIQSRFQVPQGGGRATDPQWTERRLVPLAPQTLTRLTQLAKTLHDEQGIVIAPLQLAALLLEHAAGEVDDLGAEKLARQHGGRRKSA